MVAPLFSRIFSTGAVLSLAWLTFSADLPTVQAIKHKPSSEARGHPEAVLITSRNSRAKVETTCSGALIAPNVVLTAAHCVDHFDQRDVLAPYAKKEANRATTKTARVHPDFKRGRYENDLAVLILDRPIDIGAKFPTIHGGNLLRIDTRLVVVGRVDNGTSAKDKLFLAPATLVAFPDNVNVYGGNPQVIERGDSGGPLFVAGKEQEIAAIVSGYLNFSRWNVPTDLYVPLDAKKKEWVQRQIPKPDKGTPAAGDR
jgi:secreted trypsin-like serine protease